MLVVLCLILSTAKHALTKISKGIVKVCKEDVSVPHMLQITIHCKSMYLYLVCCVFAYVWMRPYGQSAYCECRNDARLRLDNVAIMHCSLAVLQLLGVFYRL